MGQRTEASLWVMHQIHTLRDLIIYGLGNINVMDVTMMARYRIKNNLSITIATLFHSLFIFLNLLASFSLLMNKVSICFIDLRSWFKDVSVSRSLFGSGS